MSKIKSKPIRFTFDTIKHPDWKPPGEQIEITEIKRSTMMTLYTEEMPDLLENIFKFDPYMLYKYEIPLDYKKPETTEEEMQREFAEELHNIVLE